jgi:hypothetical protein
MQPGIRGMAGIIQIGQSRQVEHKADLDLRTLSEVGVTRLELHEINKPRRISRFFDSLGAS